MYIYIYIYMCYRVGAVANITPDLGQNAIIWSTLKVQARVSASSVEARHGNREQGSQVSGAVVRHTAGQSHLPCLKVVSAAGCCPLNSASITGHEPTFAHRFGLTFGAHRFGLTLGDLNLEHCPACFQ